MRLAMEIGLHTHEGWNLYICHKEETEVVWDLFEPLLARGVVHSHGMTTIEALKIMCFDGSATAFALLENDQVRAVFLARVVEYQTFNSVRIIAAGGRGLKHAFAQFHVLEAWALTKEAVEIEGWCRPAMARLLRRYGFKHRMAIVTLDLRRKLQ